MDTECPICKIIKKSESYYYHTVCKECIDIYGCTDMYDESIIVGYNKYIGIYSEKLGRRTKETECYILGKPYFIYVINDKVYFVKTIKIPKKT